MAIAVLLYTCTVIFGWDALWMINTRLKRTPNSDKP